ncbi:MAG: YbhB/YbcL family Raf kinase inhibitor-like protein [bacterium]
MGTLTLTSTKFSDGETIPDQYGYTTSNINPPLTVDGVPGEAESLVLIMDDPDALEPAGKIWDHWVVWDIDPSIGTIPEDWNASAAVEGENDYGEPGYGGPNPPDGEHTYYFKLYALDTTLDLSEGSTKDEVESAMEGHVLDKTELTGTFTP